MKRPKIRTRMSSLAAVFVGAIIPRRIDAKAQAALYERVGIDPTKCVYCGQLATDKDHFRALVSGSRPSGFFHTDDNIVPSCGPCNQSKGGSDWRLWMESVTANSPTRRGIDGTAERIARLSAFAGKISEPTLTMSQMQDAAGKPLWDRYWGRLNEIKELMDLAQQDADTIYEALTGAVENKNHPINSN